MVLNNSGFTVRNPIFTGLHAPFTSVGTQGIPRVFPKRLPYLMRSTGHSHVAAALCRLTEF